MDMEETRKPRSASLVRRSHRITRGYFIHPRYLLTHFAYPNNNQSVSKTMGFLLVSLQSQYIVASFALSGSRTCTKYTYLY